MQQKRDLVLCGSISIDRIMNFPGHYKDLIQPEKIHVLSLSVLVERLQDSRGGIAGNIAYTLSLMGEYPAIVGAIGKDGRAYLRDLTELGIDTTHIKVSKLPTSTFTVLTDQDDNQIGGFYPGAMSEPLPDSLKPWYGTDAIIVVSAHSPEGMREQVEACHKEQLTLVYDVGQQVSNVPTEDLVQGVTSATVLILNDYELGVLAKRTGKTESELKKSVPLVVVTRGKEGSEMTGTSLKEPIKIGIVPHVRVVDPTGAGDSYRAGFLYGYARGWDLKVCGQLGATTAAYAVETQGTQAHTFTQEDLAKRYQEAFNEALPSFVK